MDGWVNGADAFLGSLFGLHPCCWKITLCTGTTGLSKPTPKFSQTLGKAELAPTPDWQGHRQGQDSTGPNHSKIPGHPPSPTHRDAVPVEDEPVVGDVDCPHRWLVKCVHADHLVLLQLDALPRVQGWEGQVGRGIGGELGLGLEGRGEEEGGRGREERRH